MIDPTWAVFVAQMVEQSLSTPQIGGSNPDLGKILATTCTIEKTKIKKEAGNGPSEKKIDPTQVFKKTYSNSRGVSGNVLVRTDAI